ncbi:hypothetical protein, partial [Pseudomonas aeruginosa]|uniref:hypothetical protein n=1 Tax=Pseudomonas aeruginosa TaxID=287 RepID=UPI0031B6B966
MFDGLGGGGAFEMPLGGVFEGCGDVSFLAVLEIYYVPWQFLFLSVLCFRMSPMAGLHVYVGAMAARIYIAAKAHCLFVQIHRSLTAVRSPPWSPV